MMTPRENAMAIYNRQQPDRYFDLMDAIQLVPDPVLMSSMVPQDGLEHKDPLGDRLYLQRKPRPASPCHCRKCRHQGYYPLAGLLVVPPAKGAGLVRGQTGGRRHGQGRKNLWALCLAAACFERSHHLMGMENALCSYLEYPEEMAALLRVIADYKIDYIHEMGKQIHPDIIFYHDDWGSKQNVFLPPRVWREIIKPLQKEIADAIHEEGMLYMHHADCICQPLVLDMVEIGIDIWQGVIAQNDIVEIQRVTEGKLAMVGGIDGPKIDIEDITEEAIRAEVRRAVDTYCPAEFPRHPQRHLLPSLERRHRKG